MTATKYKIYFYKKNYKQRPKLYLKLTSNEFTILGTEIYVDV